MFFVRSLVLFSSLYFFATTTGITGTETDDHCNPPPAPTDSGCVAHRHGSPLSDKIIEAIKENVLVHVTPNKTVVFESDDQETSFEIKLNFNHCHIPDALHVGIKSYIDDCEFDKDLELHHHVNCETIENEHILISKCTFSNLQSLVGHNLTKVYFTLVITRDDDYTDYLCIPPSFLLVEEKPLNISVLNHTIDLCNGVSFVFSDFPSDTHLVCELHDNEKSAPLYLNKSCDNDTLIPTEIFHNHTGIYMLTMTPEKTVAKGETTHFKIEFIKEAIEFLIEDFSLHVIGDEFWALITLKVNHTCPLTIPNYIYPISDCFEHEKIKELLEHLNDNYVTLRHLLKTGRKLCTLQIEDSGGNIVYYDEKFSKYSKFHHPEFLDFLTGTFITQRVNIIKGHDHTYSVFCESLFVHQNDLIGCRINYTRMNDSSGNTSTEIAEMSNSRAGIIDFSGYRPGTYRIYVYDLGNDNPAVITSVIIHPSTSIGQSSSMVTSVSVSQLTSLTTTTITTEEGHTSAKGLKMAVGFLTVFAICSTVVIIILLLLKILRKKRRDEVIGGDRNGGIHRVIHGNTDEVGNNKNGEGIKTSDVYQASPSVQESSRRMTSTVEAEDIRSDEPETRPQTTNGTDITSSTYTPSTAAEQALSTSGGSEQVVISTWPITDQKKDIPSTSVPSTNKDQETEAKGQQVFVPTVSEDDTLQARQTLEDNENASATFTPTSSLNYTQIQSCVEKKDENVYSTNDPFGEDISNVDQSDDKAEYGGNTESYQAATGTSSVPSTSDPSAPLLLMAPK